MGKKVATTLHSPFLVRVYRVTLWNRCMKDYKLCFKFAVQFMAMLIAVLLAESMECPFKPLHV